MLEKNAYYHAFHQIQGCGPALMEQLLRHTRGDVAQAWHEFPYIVQKFAGEKRRERMICQWRTIHVRRSYETLQKLHISTAVIEQKEYPALLKHIFQPPYILYYQGNLNIPLSLTVVGTRKMSPYGHLAAKTILPPLAETGIGLISGLAYGIDATVHEIALEQGGYTAAVLGSGLHAMDSSGRQQLARRIVDSGGCVISQFLPDMPAQEGHFPARNRVLAGLTSLTLVLEAASRSGALITARHALDENRAVAAVPGSIHSATSNGCHQLLKDGAHMVTSAQDVLSLLQSPLVFDPTPAPAQQPSLTEKEALVYGSLSADPQDIDALHQACRLPVPDLLAILSTLEMDGLVLRFPGQGYCKHP